MTAARRKFTSEFKASAARLVLEENMTRVKVAKDLGVHINLISKWVIDFQAKGNEAFPGNGILSPQDKKVRNLEKENRQLRLERDILKKATAFFVNHGG